MRTMRRLLHRAWLRGTERRRLGTRVPITVRARLELDEIEVRGTARDICLGGIFFETTAPLAPGLRGRLRREGSAAPVPVRVTWARRGKAGRPAGLGLEFETSL